MLKFVGRSGPNVYGLVDAGHGYLTFKLPRAGISNLRRITGP